MQYYPQYYNLSTNNSFTLEDIHQIEAALSAAEAALAQNHIPNAMD